MRGGMPAADKMCMVAVDKQLSSPEKLVQVYSRASRRRDGNALRHRDLGCPASQGVALALRIVELRGMELRGTLTLDPFGETPCLRLLLIDQIGIHCTCLGSKFMENGAMMDFRHGIETENCSGRVIAI